MATVNLTIGDSIQTDVKPMNTDYVWARSRSKAFDQERKPFSWFSASCYFFGREMYEYYDGSVPIGLLATSYGGTKVECWSSPTAMKDETCGGTITSTPTTADTTISTASESATTSSSATRALENAEKRPSVSPLRALSSRSSAKADDSKPVLSGHQNQRQLFQDNDKEDRFLQFDATPPNDNYNNSVGDNNGPHCNLEDGTKDSQLWNAMIYPFLNMRFVGAVWYQGEANAAGPANYACRFPAMISDWRRQFLNNKNKDSNLFLETKTERGGVPVEPASNDGDDHYIPFVYVQLAAFENSDSDYSKIRAAQDAALAMPNVGVAHAIDLGDPDSPNGAIHPRRKQEVGRRLSLTMRALLDSDRNRKEKNDDENKYYWRGPVLLGPVQIVNHTVAILTFDARTTEGMHLHGTGGCTGCCDEGASPFETMDSDGNWTMASVVAIQGDTVTIQAAPSALDILGVHLHWQGFPQCALYNGEGGPDDHAGLPAPPVEWCAHPIPGEGPWTGKACGTQVPTLLKLAS